MKTINTYWAPGRNKNLIQEIWIRIFHKHDFDEPKFEKGYRYSLCSKCGLVRVESKRRYKITFTKSYIYYWAIDGDTLNLYNRYGRF